MARRSDVHDYVLERFIKEPTPLHAIVKFGKQNLTWLVSQIMCNMQGRPLRLLPFQSVWLDALWNKKNVCLIASRGSGKTFSLGLYAFLRALLCPGSEIIIVGSSLRQSMKVFSYIVKIYNQSPILQEALPDGPKMTNMGPYFDIGLSKVLALPIGDGEKIRGQRSTNTLADEMSSIDENIFETVIKPFAAVHADPEESVFVENFCNRLYELGADQKLLDELHSLRGYGNQTVISGTASYEFNHFFRYYESYKAIISSKGDINSIKKAMEIRARTAGNVFNQLSKEDLKMLSKSWKNYCVITMPYDKLPKGFLDIESVMNDKFTFSSSRFSMEYEARFCRDSDGFIKRSIINNATPSAADKFSIELYGDPAAEYVLGLDPAQHNDNFGAVVLRLNPTNVSLVYVDAWVGKDTPASAKKIRDILRRFNIVRIAMDQGGGGDAIAATLKLKELCEEDEVPILPIREQISDKLLLSEKGLNILEIIKFAPAWISSAAHGLEGDIQHHRLIFPSYPDLDDIYNQYANYVLMRKRLINNEEKAMLEDIVFGKEGIDFEKLNIGIWDNIEATLDETCAIERQVTPGGVERFDLPGNLGEQREGLDVRRKDRFSALMLAAYAARVYKNYNKRKPILIPGGSPEAILSKRRKARPIIRRGNVMY